MKDAERIAELEAALRRSELLVEQLQAQLNLRRRKQPASGGVATNLGGVMLEQANAGLAQLNGKLRTELAEACEVLEWIAKWGYGDGGRECAEKAAEWLEKHGANQTGGRQT